MKLSLVLALALLGAVSARQLHEGHVEQDGRAEQDEVKHGEQDEMNPGEQDEVNPGEQDEVNPGEPEPPCPTESESFRMTVQGAGGRCYRYVAVNNCQPFWRAQRLCARCYRGRLASVHSSRVNQKLRCLARSRTRRAQVWIGGFTTGRKWCRRSHWIDRSRWNYSCWARGNVLRSGRCVTLGTAGGHWRTINCRIRLPFICQY